MEPFLGMIALFGFDWAPKGWAQCNGQLLPISQNSALFSLLGTQYGGDGRMTFALPDLRGRAALSAGMGNGLSNYNQGQTIGTETTTLTIANLPSHAHAIAAASEPGDTASPQNAFMADTGAGDSEYKTAPSAASIKAMNAGMMSVTGGSQPFSIMQPYLAMNYCIALQGIFPSRN